MTLALSAYGVGPVAAPSLTDTAPPTSMGSIIDFPGIPRSFWESSAFGLVLLILAFAYVTGRLLKG